MRPASGACYACNLCPAQTCSRCSPSCRWSTGDRGPAAWCWKRSTASTSGPRSTTPRRPASARRSTRPTGSKRYAPWASSWPPRFPMPTATALSIATSSRATSSSASTAARCSPTSIWPSCRWTDRVVHPAIWEARWHTWRRNISRRSSHPTPPRRKRSTSDPTSTRWGRCSSRPIRANIRFPCDPRDWADCRRWKRWLTSGGHKYLSRLPNARARWPR